MKTKRILATIPLLALLSTFTAFYATQPSAFAQGTAFTYQGRLNSGANPAGGIYDLRFTIYDAAGGGGVWGVLTNAATPVTNGLFTVTLDFGAGVFTGNVRWLDIAVRTNGAATFTSLTPRQQILPTPYAITAAGASNLLGTLPSTQLTGTIPGSQVSGTVNAATYFTGSLAGDVTGTQNATAVANVGSSTAANIHSAEQLANAATGAALPNTIVRRDATASFSATNLTLNGNLNLPTTTANAGIIYAGGSPLMHDYGTNNFFAGPGAGNLTMTSYGYNTGVGNNALHASTLGYYNTAVGAGTLVSNTVGIDNTAVGTYALSSNTNGSWNTGIGCAALAVNTNGGANTAIGYQALLWNTSGYWNTAVGVNTLVFNMTGNGNIALGYKAGDNVLNNYNIDIGNEGVSTDNCITRLGTPGTQTDAYLAGVIHGDGSGLTNLNAALIGGLGAASFWQLGGNAGTTPGSSFLGTTDNQPLELRVNNSTALKLQPSAWGASVAAGGGATASGVTAVSMGYNTIASGSSAVALGEVTTASGDFATAMGSNTRATNTCATATGTNTLAGGVASTAIGRNTKALGTSSVSMGLWSTASGANSLAGGYNCAAAGSSSFALGYYAYADHGYSFVWNDGSYGGYYSAGDMHTTADDQFLIGATGGVGINTNNPGTAALCVNGTVAATTFNGNGTNLTNLNASQLASGTIPLARLPAAVVTNNESGVTLGGLNINGANLVMNDKDVQLRSTYDHGIGWYGSGKPFAGVSVDGPVVYGYGGGGLGIVHSGSTSNIVVYWNSSGNVGIGTTSPDALLTVNGAADKPGGGSWSTFSDVRLKKNIQPLSGVLQKLLELRGVSFEYKEPEKIHELSGERIGMIAQEVEQVFPDWVESGPEGYKRLTYRGFEALTVEALRELRDEKDVQLQARDAEMQGLNQKVEQKETEITELKARLERLEQLVTAKSGGGQ